MKKIAFKRTKKAPEAPSRITNETVAEHREQVLAGGRRFKYPVQYARHKLVLNALIIAFVSLIAMGAFGWWQLYIVQNSGDFFYRVTRILPLPVASVNGQSVPYDDYLVQYRGSEHYLIKYEDINNSADRKTQLDYIKRQSMDKAIADAYAAKLAGPLGIHVSDKDVDAVVAQQRNTANGEISQETHDASLLMFYGWSPSDYRLDIKLSLLKNLVAYAIDTKASAQQVKAVSLLKSNKGDIANTAATLGGVGTAKVATGVSGLVNISGTFNGINISDLAKLKVDVLSSVIKSTTGDGYYFVKVIEENATQISFAFLHIPLTEFDNQLAALKKAGKVQEYISVPKI